MGFTSYFLIGVVLMLDLSRSSHSIKVDFGTRKGPIIPPTSTTARSIDPKSYLDPAPVYERETNDIPNPAPYRPFLPYQYRNKIQSAFEKAPASIYYGTEYDQKYVNRDLPYQTLRKIAKYNAEAQKNYHLKAKKPLASSSVNARSVDTDVATPAQNTDTTYTAASGRDYRGPQTFGPEHFIPVKPVYTVQYFGNSHHAADLDRRIVPQFGVLYSNGVKYYVPRVDDFSESENSVYEDRDVKYYNRY